MPVHVEKVLKETIARITGLKKGCPPLGSIKVENGESALSVANHNDWPSFLVAIATSANPLKSV